MDYKARTFSEDDLATRDIAELNLDLARGLPGSEDLDIPALLRKVDHWAAIVEKETGRYFQRRSQRDSELSDNQFRILAMVTTLQQKLGVKYNLATLEGDYDATDSRNQFIHGLLLGFGGTCVSMPVLYAAIGRRLGYPIQLAFAMEHMFCRWDDGQGERFNIEATARGFISHSDDEYLIWPKPIPDASLKTGRFLRNLSHREELAFFFGERAFCCLDNFATEQAITSFAYALEYSQDQTYAVWHDVAVVFHKAITELRRQSKLNPSTRQLELPAPQTPFESELYSMANQHFTRIVAIHSKKQEQAAD